MTDSDGHDDAAQRDDGDLAVTQDGGVLTVTFNRPERHNAMTFAMYDGLYDACERVDSDEQLHVLVLRGTGGKAFASGTDIGQFRDMRDGSDGVAYEQRIAKVVDRLEDVTVPTVAAVEGYCLGGGLVVAAACDIRVATRSARFGAPIARTLGNCLSMNSTSVLVAHLGPARTLDLLLRARLLDAQEAHDAGFVAQVCDDGQLADALAEVVTTLCANAPLTMWATKVAVARLRRATLPDGNDLVQKAFGSNDFHRAVQAFGSGQGTAWSGR